MSTRWYIHGLSIALSFGAAIDIKAEPVDDLAQIKKALTAQCIAQVPRIFNLQVFSPVFARHPVDFNSICSCAEAATFMDSRVRKHIDTAPALSGKQAALPQLQGYVAARFMSAMFSCSVPEIDAALDSTESQSRD